MKKGKNSEFLKQLEKDREFLTNQNEHIVDAITDLCIKQIKLLNSMGNTNYIYEVPSFLLGFPLYDVNLVSIYVNKNLKKMTLKTVFIKPNKIYISWKKI